MFKSGQRRSMIRQMTEYSQVSPLVGSGYEHRTIRLDLGFVDKIEPLSKPGVPVGNNMGGSSWAAALYSQGRC
jgi:hypothetical protein